MELRKADIAKLADDLWHAENARRPIRPLTDSHPDLSVRESYDIQLANVRRRVTAGERICGHKIGLTARAMQEQMGIHEPDYGHLFHSMFEFESTAIAMDGYIAPRIELETAFILGQRLEGPGITVADVIRAIDWVVPSFEIIDSRIADWRIKLADTIADNGSSGGVILGGHPRRLGTVDLRSATVVLHVDGAPVDKGSTGSVLGNPLSSVAWLANALARHGVAMESGHVVLPGACLRSVPVRPGMTVRAEFEGLGDVRTMFE